MGDLEDRVRILLKHAGVEASSEDISLIAQFIQRGPQPSRPRRETEPALTPGVPSWKPE